jgi:hypothetical protein
LKAVNGTKNMVFGFFGMLASGAYSVKTAGIGAAAGGSIGFGLSMSEVSLGALQVKDAFFPKTEQQMIHDYSNVLGLTAGYYNSPYDKQWDAIGGLLPGAMTGGNFDSLYDLYKISYKSDVKTVLQGVDAEEDMRAGINSIIDLKDKKK